MPTQEEFLLDGVPLREVPFSTLTRCHCDTCRRGRGQAPIPSADDSLIVAQELDRRLAIPPADRDDREDYWGYPEDDDSGSSDWDDDDEESEDEEDSSDEDEVYAEPREMPDPPADEKPVRIPQMPRCIKAIGMEVEGGWNRKPGFRTKYDGSLSDGLAEYVGEAVSRPLTTLVGACRWLDAVWPHRTDARCGFHIHLSFKLDRDYVALADTKFLDWFVRRMEEWGREQGIKNEQFYRRLAGENSYCERTTRYIEGQLGAHGRPQSRYTVWNFCYSQHGTAECRVLPTFKYARTAKLAMLQTVKLVCEWIDSYKHELPEVILEVVESPENENETKFELEIPYVCDTVVYDEF